LRGGPERKKGEETLGKAGIWRIVEANTGKASTTHTTQGTEGITFKKSLLRVGGARSH